MSLVSVQNVSSQLIVDDGVTRETVENVTTNYAKKIALNPFASQYNSSSTSLIGGKIVGIGKDLLATPTERKPGITLYTYNGGDGAVVSPVTQLPLFIEPDLTYNIPALCGYANIDSHFSDTDLKKGIVSARDPIATNLDTRTGQTYFWGPEQSVGYINAVAVCIDDIRQLKYKSENDEKVFSGMCIKGYDEESDMSVSYFKNGIAGVTPANSIFIKLGDDLKNVFSYNLMTGVTSKVDGLPEDTLMAVWGTQMYEVDDNIYFLGKQGSSVHLCRRNIESGYTTVGEKVADKFSLRGTECGNIVRLNNAYYYCVPSDKSQVLSIILKRIDLGTLTLSEDILSYSLPIDFNMGHCTVHTLANDHFIITDGVRGVSFEVASLQGITKESILKVYYTCAGLCSSISYGEAIYLLGYGKQPVNFPYKFAYMIMDTDTSPLLGYGTTKNTYNKTEQNTLTLTHLFEVV
jgi:hypothetical protein